MKNKGGVNFDQTRLSIAVRGRSLPGIPLFHLIDSSKNTVEKIPCCIFPSGLGEHTFTKYGGERWPFWTLFHFCAQIEPNCISPGYWSKSQAHFILSLLCSCFSEMPSKVMLSCYGSCPTLGRMPRGCGRPSGHPQEAGPESAESLCTSASQAGLSPPHIVAMGSLANVHYSALEKVGKMFC